MVGVTDSTLNNLGLIGTYFAEEPYRLGAQNGWKKGTVTRFLNSIRLKNDPLDNPEATEIEAYRLNGCIEAAELPSQARKMFESELDLESIHFVLLAIGLGASLQDALRIVEEFPTNAAEEIAIEMYNFLEDRLSSADMVEELVDPLGAEYLDLCYKLRQKGGLNQDIAIIETYKAYHMGPYCTDLSHDLYIELLETTDPDSARRKFYAWSETLRFSCCFDSSNDLLSPDQILDFLLNEEV